MDKRPINADALVKRINRRLAPYGGVMRKSRGMVNRLWYEHSDEAVAEAGCS